MTQQQEGAERRRLQPNDLHHLPRSTKGSWRQLRAREEGETAGRPSRRNCVPYPTPLQRRKDSPGHLNKSACSAVHTIPFSPTLRFHLPGCSPDQNRLTDSPHNPEEHSHSLSKTPKHVVRRNWLQPKELLGWFCALLRLRNF